MRALASLASTHARDPSRVEARGSSAEKRGADRALALSTDLKVKVGTGRVPRGTLPGSPKYVLLGSYSTGGTGGLLMGEVLMTSDS